MSKVVTLAASGSPPSVDVRKQWVVTLAKLVAPTSRFAEAVAAMVGFLEFLDGLPDAAFNRDTAIAIAEIDRKGGLPSFAEVSGVLKAWWRDNRPMFVPVSAGRRVTWPVRLAMRQARDNGIGLEEWECRGILSLMPRGPMDGAFDEVEPHPTAGRG